MGVVVGLRWLKTDSGTYYLKTPTAVLAVWRPLY